MRYVRHAGMALCIIGLLLVGRGVFEVAGGKIYQAWRGRQLDRTLQSLPPQPTRHRVSYQPGSAIGRLEIPRLDISVVVLEGSDTEALRLGVGRLHNSSLPGEPGNVVLAGHRDTFFRSLREIRHGDRISLRTTQGTFSYIVDWTQVVNPEDTSVLLPTPAPSLTLVTCYPFYYVGSAPQRFIVRALPPGVAPNPTLSASTSASTPSAAPTPRPRRRIVAVIAAPAVPVEEAPPVAAPPPVAASPVAAPPDPPKHGLKAAFHKLARVFSSRRAKLQ